MSLPLFSWLRGPQQTSTPRSSQQTLSTRELPPKEQTVPCSEHIDTPLSARDGNGHSTPFKFAAVVPAAKPERDRAPMPPPPIICMNVEQSNNNGDFDDEEDEPTTPKATSFGAITGAVPLISQTSADSQSNEEPSSPDMPPPMFPAPFSAQRAGGGIAARSAASSAWSSAPSGGSLMAPPPRPGLQPRRRGPLTLTASGPSPIPPPYGQRNNLLVPNRGLPPGVASRTPASVGTSSLALPPTTTSKSTKPSRKKVMLTPGHSPLDWAYLTNDPNANLRNLPPDAPYLLRVTPSQLKSMNGRKGRDAWTVLGGFVYNISPYLPFHPGGEGELLRCAGKDGNKLFSEVHSWVNYDNMLGACRIGIMVEEHASTASPMEEMD